MNSQSNSGTGILYANSEKVHH